MNREDLAKRVIRAKELLKEIHHIPIATVNSDGTPHLSPLFMVFDKELRGYWSSSIDSQHSLNISGNKNIFLTVFDSRIGHGGLFMSGEGKVLKSEREIKLGYDLLSKQKGRMYGAMLDLELYKKLSTQRIYCFEPEEFWINFSIKNETGAVINDKRHEIHKSDLI